MEAAELFTKLDDACTKVLKGKGSALSTQRMTLEQFADYATDQVTKAQADSSKPERALARIHALRGSISVAKSAFTEAQIETFEIPVYDSSVNVEQQFGNLESQLDSLSDSIKQDDDADKDDDDETKAKKAKAEEDKKKEDEEKEKAAKAKAKGKAVHDDDDEEMKAKKAKQAEEDKKKEDEEKEKANMKKVTSWPRDIAKSALQTDEEKELYDWGNDPQ